MNIWKVIYIEYKNYSQTCFPKYILFIFIHKISRDTQSQYFTYLSHKLKMQDTKYRIKNLPEIHTPPLTISNYPV